jgi:hypothetical protein
MDSTKPHVTATAHEMPFDKLSPRDFERLCLWLVEREGFERAEHLGAAGSEQGRDVIAWRGDELWTFQCKRVQRFGPGDALAEVEKILALPASERPVALVFIVTCDVSANTRQQVRELCTENDLGCHFWVGTELDEKVKAHSDILEEFFRQPASISHTTHIGQVTGPVHSGSGDIIYTPSDEAPPTSAPLLPNLVLKLFKMSRDQRPEDGITLDQSSNIFPNYKFGVVLENTQEGTVAAGIRITLRFYWRGGKPGGVPRFHAPSCPGWKTQIDELVSEQEAELAFRDNDLRCFYRQPEKWENFRLVLPERMNGYFLVTYRVSSAEPVTDRYDQLRITLV